jgi:adenylate cyclase
LLIKSPGRFHQLPTSSIQIERGVRKLLVGLGLGSVALLTALGVGATSFGRVVEMKAYDVRVRLAARPQDASRDIVLVNIDEDSIRKLEPVVGRYPWPRLAHATLVDYLASAGVRAVAYDVLFSERDRTSFSVQGETWTGGESDQAFVDAVRKAGNVVLASDATREAEESPGAAPNQAAGPGTPGGTAPAASQAALEMFPAGFRLSAPLEERPIITPPFDDLAWAARALGHSYLVLDSDGPARRSVPFVRVGGRAVPSLAVATALVAMDMAPDRVRSDGEYLWLGDARMPLVAAESRTLGGTSRPSRRALVRFAGPLVSGGRDTYEQFSFYQLFYSALQMQEGKPPLVAPARLRGKIVFVGVTAAGLHDTFAVPFEGAMPGSAIHANVVDNILTRRFMTPAPAFATYSTVAACALALALVCAFLGPWWTIAAAAAMLAALGAGSLVAFGRGTWLPVVPAVVATAAATFAGVAEQYLVEGREKRKIKRVFSRMVAPDVYEHLVADPARARLGGERREMTVLFADIRGFTTLTENGRAEDIVAQLNEYFTRMVEVLFEHRGTVDKFVGDMVMALFGAPVPDPRHADCAVQASLHMVRALEDLNARWAREGRPRLDIGVGINSGEMIVGNVGSEQIMSYTVIGDAVNLASRLESLNKQYGTTILISDDTRRLLGAQYGLRALGETTVKGKSRAVAVYAVEGEGT